MNIRQKKLYKWRQEEGFLERSEKRSRSLMFSVVIPTFNQVETIEDTLQSVIRQDYGNIELIVIDGGSTDGTVDLIQGYRQYISYFESKRDAGQSSAINKGFRKASGDIYAWINSDDFYLEGAFTKVAKCFDENEKIDIVIGGGDIVTKDCKFLKHIPGIEMVRSNLLAWDANNWIMQQSCFWKADLWKESGGVDETLNLLMDYDLWFRYSKLGLSKTINTDLAVMRYYPSAKTVLHKNRAKEEVAYVYGKNGAYDNLRKLVRDLVHDKEELEKRMTKQERRLSIRLFKRIGLGGI
jgi:glycosyltransferase involved in cell wall biosynthesis